MRRERRFCRFHKRCKELEVISITNTGTQLNITVAQTPLDDGWHYRVALFNQIPMSVTGAEQVVITVGTTTIVVGDRRARILRANQIRRKEVLCMLYTQDSIANNTEASATAVPAFLVEEGIAHLG